MHVLKLPTDPRWVKIAEKSLEDILTDHAYCEQKAASSCISLIQHFPEKEKLVEELTPIVTEEWEHFAAVLQQLKKRDLKLGRQRKDEYVNRLLKCMKKDGSRDEQLMERLIVAALIEARSSERFRILSKEIEDAELKQFYYELMQSEMGHYRLFLDLAMEYQSKEKVMKRWDEYLVMEAEIIATLEVRGDRMH